MNEQSVLLKAVQVALMAHDGQKRKGGNDPYLIHPLRVAELLSQVALLPHVSRFHCIIAAILHDIFEDCPDKYTLEEMQRDFGEKITTIVLELTQDMSLSREERRRLMLEHCASMSPEAKAVKLADRLDNMRDMHNLGDQFIARYTRETKEMLEKMKGACLALEAEILGILPKA